jgi:hypothetical protein
MDAIVNYKKIESPLSAFNNILNQIVNKLLLLYDKKQNDVDFVNSLLFEENAITILGKIKIVYKQEKIGLKFLGIFDNYDLIHKTLKNELELKQIFQHYLFTISSLTNNFDSSISQKYVDNIIEQVQKPDYDKNIYYVIPYKNKIKHLYDVNDKLFENLYTKYSYVLKLDSNRLTFSYNLLRVLSTDLNESKSLENLRFEDIEVLKTDTLPINRLSNFLTDLFYYGEINN